MEIDFQALASRVASTGDVVACIVLSSDDMVVGSFPPGDERSVKPAWLAFASLGEPRRGFVTFPNEVWAYVSHGPYAAFAVGTAASRPGVLLDRLEQALLVAVESRSKLEAGRPPETVDLAERPRAPKGGRKKKKHAPPPPRETPEAVPAPEAADEPEPEPEPEEEQAPLVRPAMDGEEVDRVVLAREFAGLLQEDPKPDEEQA